MLTVSYPTLPSWYKITGTGLVLNEHEGTATVSVNMEPQELTLTISFIFPNGNNAATEEITGETSLYVGCWYTNLDAITANAFQNVDLIDNTITVTNVQEAVNYFDVELVSPARVHSNNKCYPSLSIDPSSTSVTWLSVVGNALRIELDPALELDATLPSVVLVWSTIEDSPQTIMTLDPVTITRQNCLLETGYETF